MSADENTRLLERAMDLLDNITSHPSGYDRSLWVAIKGNDLDEVRRIVHLVEANLAQEHFFNNDLMGA